MPILINESLDWQSNLITRDNRLCFLYDKKLLTDICFLVGPNKEEIKAHKLILMMSSSEFEKMLRHSVSKRRTIEIEDVKPEIFQAMLQFLYKGEISIKKENTDSIMNLLIAADKYKLKELKQKCCCALIHELKDSNVLSIYHLSIILDALELKEITFQYICRHAATVFNIEGNLNINISTLLNLLKSDDLNISELALIKFVMKWGKESCKLISNERLNALKSLVNKVVPHLRFNLLDAADIVVHIAPEHFFPDEQIIKMFSAAATPSAKCNPGQQNQKPPLVENIGHPRTSFGFAYRYAGKTPTVMNVSDIIRKSPAKSDMLSFKVSKQLKILGVGLFGLATVFTGEGMHWSPEITYKVQIFNKKGKMLTGQNGTQTSCEKIIHVEFRTPVSLIPDEFYTIISSVKSVGARYTGTGAPSHLQVPWKSDCITFTFDFKKQLEFTIPDSFVKQELAASPKECQHVRTGEFPYIFFTD